MSNEFIHPVNPQLATVLNMFGANLSRSINVMLPGEVVSYDDAKGTASVKIMLQRKLVDGRTLDYPMLSDCPVFTMNGGGAYLSFPIEPGDSCCVFFADRSIDEWYQSGEARTPMLNHAHSLSDGFVLVGPRPQSKPLGAPSDIPTLNGKSKKLRIKNDAQALKTILNTMLDAIIGSTGTVAGSACTITANPNIATAKALIAQLLED